MFELLAEFSGSTVPETVIRDIMEINEKSLFYSLNLTKDDVLALVYGRKSALWDTDRIEFRYDTIEKIIEKFYKSPYINQHEYVEIINEIQYVFYVIKNETGHTFSDDRIIELMVELFDGPCGGSLELLKGVGFEYIMELAGNKIAKNSAKINRYHRKTEVFPPKSASSVMNELAANSFGDGGEMLKKSLGMLVSELIYGYTNGKSASVKAEEAEKIARSVLFASEMAGLRKSCAIDALREAYYSGLEVIDGILRDARLLYKKVRETRIITDLNEYNNSIDNAGAFFKYYDKRYASAEIPVEISYLPVKPLKSSYGVTFIYDWLSDMLSENVICGLFDEKSVSLLLKAYRDKIEKEAGLAFSSVNLFELIIVNSIFASAIGNQPTDIVLNGEDRREIEKVNCAHIIDKAVNYFLQFFDVTDERLTEYISQYASTRLLQKIEASGSAVKAAVFLENSRDNL